MRVGCIFCSIIVSLCYLSCSNKQEEKDTESSETSSVVVPNEDIECEMTEIVPDVSNLNNELVVSEGGKYSLETFDLPLFGTELYLDPIITCPACFGTGKDYDALTTPLINQNLIGVGVTDVCVVCLGEGKVQKSVATKRYEAVMEVREELAEIEKQRRNTPCVDCDGKKVCSICFNRV